MIELRHRGTGSWLDPRSSKGLAAALSHRLWERCRGHKGLVLTLTYQRDAYRNAQDLYHRQGEQQHVALFMRKVGRYLGESLNGRWFCKLEFQRGGWVHFHVIVLDVPRIPHEHLARMWGHGFIKVRRLTPRAIRYCTKYLTKDDGVPSWLYGERPRSIKIIRVSAGFWGNTPEVVAEPTEDDDGVGEEDPYDRHGPGLLGRGVRSAAYVPIGTKIEKNWHRFVVRDEEGHYRQGDADLGPLLAALLVLGCGIVGREGNWLVIDGTLEDVDEASRAAASWLASADGRRSVSGGGRRDDGRGDAINSIQTSNPDAASMPHWLQRFQWDEAEGRVAS